MSEVQDKRRSARVRTRFETLYCSERQEGGGTLAEISYTGARLEGTELQPRIGSRVRVHILVSDRPHPIELVGQVVRHTEGGFAIEYEKLSAEIRGLVDEAAALVDGLEPE